MNRQYLTRSELTKRWSWELIERFFPTCSKTVPDPHGKNGTLKELYDIHQVRLTESTHTFMRENEKYKRRVKAIRWASGMVLKHPCPSLLETTYYIF